MASLTLVRHGQGSFGTDDYDRLSELGNWQAATLGDHWQRATTRFERHHCGALLRQRQTAAKVLGAMQIANADFAVNDAFNEYQTEAVFGRYMRILLDEDEKLRDIFTANREAGRDREISRRVFFPVLSRWVADAQRDDLGFESFSLFKHRVQKALRNTAADVAPGTHEGVFTSSGVIAIAMMHALNLPDAAFVDVGWHIHNASVTQLAVHDGKLGVVQFNGTMHLEATGRDDALTWL